MRSTTTQRGDDDRSRELEDIGRLALRLVGTSKMKERADRGRHVGLERDVTNELYAPICQISGSLSAASRDVALTPMFRKRSSTGNRSDRSSRTRGSATPCREAPI